MESTMNKKEQILVSLTGIAMACAMVMTLLQVKIINLGFMKFTAATFLVVPFYFLIGLITDVWGKKQGRFTVYLTMLTRFIFYAAIVPLLLMMHGPLVAPLDKVVHTTIRMMIAGDLAVLSGTLLALIPAIGGLKKYHLLPRFSLAQLSSMVVSSTVFILIAFFGTGQALWPLLFGQATSRVVLALLLSLMAPMAEKVVSNA